MVKKILLFGDIGIDDTVALIYASLTKGVEIVADYSIVSNVYSLQRFDEQCEGVS